MASPQSAVPYGPRPPRRPWGLTPPRWVGFLPAVVVLAVVLFVSGLPISQDLSGWTVGTPSAPAAAPASTAPTVAALPTPSNGPAGAASAGNLCLDGVMQECAPGSSAAPVSPDGPAVSSWTNITPPVPSSNPTERQLPAVSYDPYAHDVILFGGYGYAPGAAPATSAPVFLGDTWSYVDNRWTELINQSTCTASSCPSPRAGAMLTYFPADSGLILFGGYISEACLVCGRPIIITYNDTWLFANNTWTNLTDSSGSAPQSRYAGAMVYDPSDDYIVLFGGNDGDLNSLGDTWSFDGTWTNLTLKEGGITGYESGEAPEPRSFAAIANSPSGYVLLFGGADSREEAAEFDIIQDSCNNGSWSSVGDSAVGWWFHQGLWTPMNGWGDICPPPPPKRPAAGPVAAIAPEVSSILSAPPCGRIESALGWSPKNAQFALYGGYGSADQGADANCTDNVEVLNDTWVYGSSGGGPFLWHNGGDSGDPPAREGMGYASDFTDDYFEIFGGLLGTGGLANATWRFYEVVHAKLTGPTAWNTGLAIHLTTPPFLATGYGGSGDLEYTLRAVGLRTANTLAGAPGCSPITDGVTETVPSNGTESFVCEPKASSFNLYKIVLSVWDAKNTTDLATSSWVYEVIPPEAEAVYSEYVQYFYQGITLSNTFTVFAQVNGEPASRIVATIGNSAVTFTQTSGSPKYWNATVAMKSVAKGAVVHAEALWGNWSLNATYDLTMISFPSWLASVYAQTGGNESVVSSGHGPFNKTYTVDEAYSWNLGDGLGFSLPIDLLGGDYDVIPSMTVNFNATSMGDLAVTATLPLSQPSIDIGPASLQFTIGLSLSGTFSVSGSSVSWVSAYAEITIGAALSMSVPIYGFSILGINVGFTLQVQVNVTAALKLILAPTTNPSDDIIPGIGIMIQNFVGTLTFALSAAVNFGIGIASVGLGAGVSVALSFVTQPDFAIHQGWVNGSIFVEASFLFWSDSWNIASGTIYSWDPPAPLEPAAALGPAYDNGSNTTWSLSDRYYNVSGVYDSNVWDPTLTVGRAIDDIYPSTEVTGATGYNGAYLFFTNDDVTVPVQDGLQVAGERLDGTTNELGGLPVPRDPGYLLFSPHATTLPNGSLYVVWEALPDTEATLASPLDLTSLDLQGASFDPVNESWGPVRTFSTTGFAESAAVDASGGTAAVLELVSTAAPLVNDSSPERLVEYALGSGTPLSDVGATGLSEIVSFRGSSSFAIVETVGGNYSLVDTATGAAVALGTTPPLDSNLTSATFVTGSPSTLVLLYASGNRTELVLYDTATGATLATETLGSNVSEAEGITTGGAVYLFVRDGQGVEGWSESAGVFRDLAHAAIPHLESYGLVQDGAAIVVYGLATNGTTVQPTVSLWFVEVSAALAPAPIPAAAQPSASPAGVPLGYLVYLAAAGAAVAALLVALSLRGRRPRAPAPLPAYAGPNPSSPSAPSPAESPPPGGG